MSQNNESMQKHTETISEKTDRQVSTLRALLRDMDMHGLKYIELVMNMASNARAFLVEHQIPTEKWAEYMKFSPEEAMDWLKGAHEYTMRDLSRMEAFVADYNASRRFGGPMVKICNGEEETITERLMHELVDGKKPIEPPVKKKSRSIQEAALQWSKDNQNADDAHFYGFIEGIRAYQSGELGELHDDPSQEDEFAAIVEHGSYETLEERKEAEDDEASRFGDQSGIN